MGLPCRRHRLRELTPVSVEVRDGYAGDHEIGIELEDFRVAWAYASWSRPARLQIGVQVHVRPHLERILFDRALGERDRALDIAAQELEARHTSAA